MSDYGLGNAEPSLMKNLSSGSGCGCGCVGLLVVLLGVIALVGMPLQVYDESGASTAALVGTASLVLGTLIAVMGGVIWIGSWFID